MKHPWFLRKKSHRHHHQKHHVHERQRQKENESPGVLMPWCVCGNACMEVRGRPGALLSTCHCVLRAAPAILTLCSVFCRCCRHCVWSWIFGEFQPGALRHHVAAAGGLKAWPVHQTQSVSREQLSLSTCTVLGICWWSLSLSKHSWSRNSKKPGSRLMRT